MGKNINTNTFKEDDFVSIILRMYEEKTVRTSLCRICRSNPADSGENSGSEMCSQCRVNYIRYPFPFYTPVILAFAAGLILIGMIFFGKHFDSFLTFKKGEFAYNSRKYLTAADNFADLTGEEYTGKVAAGYLYLSLSKSGDSKMIDQAITLSESIKDNISLRNRKELKEFLGYHEKYKNSYRKVLEFYNKYLGDALEYTDEQLNPLISDITQLIDSNNTTYDKSALLLYRAIFKSNLKNPDYQDIIKDCDQSYKLNNKNLDSLNIKARVQLEYTNQLKEAKKTIDAVLRQNRQNTEASYYKIDYYLKIKNYKKMLKEAQKLYLDTNDGLDRLAIAYHLNNMPTQRDLAVEAIESEGNELPQFFYDYINGYITLDDFLNQLNQRS